MKHILLLFLLLAVPAAAQRDTLSYDRMNSVDDGQLINISLYETELESVLNARFTPTGKCRLEGLLLGFSVVKFQPASGDDTLEVIVYEQSAPPLKSVQNVERVNLGNLGYPKGNINVVDPLLQSIRGLLYIPFTTPIAIAPMREFLIGVKVRSRQRMTIGTGVWNGFTMATAEANPEYLRYRRYITYQTGVTVNEAASAPSSRGFFMRAVVNYDPSLPDTRLTGVLPEAAPTDARLLANYPNPFNPSTTIAFTAERAGRATLDVHDGLGRRVARLIDGEVPAGRHEVRFDASAASAFTASGMYTAVLCIGATVRTAALHLLK